MNKKNLVLFSAPVLFMVLLLARGESPIIKWQPERIDISVFQGGARLIDIEFIIAVSQDKGANRVIQEWSRPEVLAQLPRMSEVEMTLL